MNLPIRGLRGIKKWRPTENITLISNFELIRNCSVFPFQTIFGTVTKKTCM